MRFVGEVDAGHAGVGGGGVFTVVRIARRGILKGFVPHVRVGADIELGTEEDDLGGVAVGCETFGGKGYFDGFEEGVFECQQELGWLKRHEYYSIV